MNTIILLAGLSPSITPEEIQDLQNLQRFQCNAVIAWNNHEFSKRVLECNRYHSLLYPHLLEIPSYREYIRLCKWHFEVWDELDWIFRCYATSPDDQIRHMRKLSLLIGEDAYHAGKLPPPAPFCLFREIP